MFILIILLCASAAHAQQYYLLVQNFTPLNESIFEIEFGESYNYNGIPVHDMTIQIYKDIIEEDNCMIEYNYTNTADGDTSNMVPICGADKSTEEGTVADILLTTMGITDVECPVPTGTYEQRNCFKYEGTFPSRHPDASQTLITELSMAIEGILQLDLMVLYPGQYNDSGDDSDE